MHLRAILILGMIGLAAGVWWAAWTIVRTNWTAKREWPRVIGKITSVANPLRPIVKVEQGIEFAPPIVQTDGPSPYEPDERVLDLESDEGLRWGPKRIVFLINPVTKQARVARAVTISPFLLALLGAVYLALVGGFYWVTNPSPPPGEWTASDARRVRPDLPEDLFTQSSSEWNYYQTPSWTEPALLSAKMATWSWFQFLLEAAIGLFCVVMFWTGRSSLGARAGYGSIALFVVGVLSFYALDKATYQIEADSTGLRECSAAGWKLTPWRALRGAVDETVYYVARRSRGGSTPMLDHVTHRVYFTDDQQSEVVSIGDDLIPDQANALLDHVLSRTHLQPEKREIERLMLTYRR
ncbi:MAG: hypothetical protein ABSA41_18100 [Terriglobia bacterium]